MASRTLHVYLASQENFHPLFSGVGGPAIDQIPQLPFWCPLAHDPPRPSPLAPRPWRLSPSPSALSLSALSPQPSPPYRLPPITVPLTLPLALA